MLEAKAVVVKVEDHHIWVEAGDNNACGACVQKAACSSQVLSDRLRKKSLPVDSIIKLNIGDQVLLGIDEASLLRASLLLYLLPIVALFIGAGIMDGLLPDNAESDVWIALSAILSFACCLWFIKQSQQRLILDYFARPVVMKKL